MASWNWPALVNKISTDVPFISTALKALLKLDPTGIEDIPSGAKRLVQTATNQWDIQNYSGTAWATIGKLMLDVDKLDGYHASTSATANTIPVRNSSGQLPGDITGNAATATTAAALSEVNTVALGGTGASTAANARTNLGVPPTNHRATATTYGVGNGTYYGHVKLSDATDGTSGVAGGVAATPLAVSTAIDELDEGLVHTTGDETIAGTKTFSSTISGSVSGSAGSAAKWTTSRNIGGISINGAANAFWYATCSTAAATAAKTASRANFTLTSGAWIAIRFSYANTAASPTLNVNSTGAKNIRYCNANISANTLKAAGTYLFVYDGTYYQLVGFMGMQTSDLPTASTSTAGIVKLSNAYTAANANVAATQTAVYNARSNILTGTPNFTGTLKFDVETDYPETHGLPFGWVVANTRSDQITGIRGGTAWETCPCVLLYGNNMAAADDQSDAKGSILLLSRGTRGEPTQNYAYLYEGDTSFITPHGRLVGGDDIIYRYWGADQPSDMYAPDGGTWLVIYWRQNGNTGYNSVDTWFGEMAGGTRIAAYINGTRAWAVCIRKWE